MALRSVSTPDDAYSWRVYLWENATASDTFEPVKVDRTPYAIVAQVSGDFSGSASIGIHGSVDGVNYVALPDLQGLTVALAAAGLANIGIAALYLKPVLTDGDGSTDISARILVRFDGP